MSLMVENKSVQNMVLKRVKSNLSLLEGNLFRDGKRHASARVVFSVSRNLKKQEKLPVSVVLRSAFANAYPYVVMRSKKVGGSIYQIPVHLNEDKQNKVAVKWILTCCGTKLGNRLAAIQSELLSATANEGLAVQKKKTLHNLAVSNRAYIKYL